MHLEHPGIVFEPGSRVTGAVTLRADAPVVLAVPLFLEWHAHGKGNEASEALVRETLFDGSLDAGEERTLPFELEVPAAAAPYAGSVFQVDLRLRALAAIATDPAHRHAEVTAPLQVAPPPPPRRFRVKPVSEVVPANAMKSLIQLLALAFLGVLLVVLSVVAPSIGFIGPCAGSVVAVGLVLAAIVFKRAMAERKVGSVTVAIEQEGSTSYRDDPGSAPLSVVVTTGARHATAQVRLRVQEVSTRGYGNDSTSYHETLFDETVELADDAGELRGRLRMPTPGEVPLPFQRGRHRVEWDVFVTIDAPGAPEWLQHHELEVTGE